ncbi:uncharacterized protein LOC124386405 [Silurus meridionalis]|uniref:uncharacterized protein LOC124386405 n=1 Tax=Silurus meridionalis TaxID=175797 RepID=UPI001EEA44A9|nr:uncharacterized protein LOC124386405 [Silurus meridionalis]
MSKINPHYLIIYSNNCKLKKLCNIYPKMLACLLEQELFGAHFRWASWIVEVDYIVKLQSCREEVVTLCSAISVFKERRPALFTETQVRIKCWSLKCISLQSQSIENKRDAVLSCLIEYLGEPQEELFQDSQLNMKNDQEGQTEQTMKVLLIHNPMAEDDPVDVSIVIEGIQLISGCGYKTKACMLLIGLIYALNLEYPKKLKNFFWS